MLGKFLTMADEWYVTLCYNNYNITADHYTINFDDVCLCLFEKKMLRYCLIDKMQAKKFVQSSIYVTKVNELNNY